MPMPPEITLVTDTAWRGTGDLTGTPVVVRPILDDSPVKIAWSNEPDEPRPALFQFSDKSDSFGSAGIQSASTDFEFEDGTLDRGGSF